jgi:hypothetical protein
LDICWKAVRTSWCGTQRTLQKKVDDYILIGSEAANKGIGWIP